MSHAAQGPSAAIEIDTPAGRMAVDPADIVTFPHGLPGFEACRRFVLVAPSTIAPFTWLQGLDDARPSFLAIDPRAVSPDYEAAVGAADRARLGAEPTTTCLWLAIVRVSGDGLTANLSAPVVINPARMVGVQALGAESSFGADHPIATAA